MYHILTKLMLTGPVVPPCAGYVLIAVITPHLFFITLVDNYVSFIRPIPVYVFNIFYFVNFKFTSNSSY